MMKKLLLWQRGMATLIVAFILIVAIGIVTLIGARSNLLHLKTQTNEYQYKLAFESAQFGLQQGIAYLGENYAMVDNSSLTTGWLYGTAKWVPCSGTDTTIPCGNGKTAKYGSEMLAYKNVPNLVAPSNTNTSMVVHFLTQNAGSNKPDNKPAIKVIAIGSADQARAQSIIQQEVKGKNLFLNITPSPLSATGNVVLTGNFNTWGHQIGVNVFSIWSAKQVMPMSGSAVTYDVRLPTGQYPNTTSKLSYGSNNAGDIIQNNPAFPSDLFYYIFGVPKTEYTEVMNNAKVYADCSSLNSASYGLIWITGDCSITGSNGGQLGSTSLPVMVVVSGALKMTANTQFYGGVFLRDTSSGISIAGTLDVHGIFAVDTDLNLGSGTVNITYDEDTLKNLNNIGGTVVYVPGSWNDDYD